MTYIATVTQKGQVTIPSDIRKFLGVKSYEKVKFIRKNDQVVLKPAKSFLDLKGSVKSKRKYSDKDADKSVTKYIKKSYEEKNSST